MAFPSAWARFMPALLRSERRRLSMAATQPVIASSRSRMSPAASVHGSW